MHAIEVSALHKSFVSHKGPPWSRKVTRFPAVKDVTFTVPQGQIFSLLGPNGAGKTTTIKILATLLMPDAGHARILGHDVISDDLAVRRRLGTVLPGERTLYWKLTVRENLDYFAGLMGLRRSWAKGRIAELLRIFELEDKAGALVEKLSTGLRQRAVLCRALLTDPEVLLLDEPTLGLDPLAARGLRNLVRTIREQGKTVLLTTHYMYEADELSDTVAIMHEGSLVAMGTPRALKASLSEQRCYTLAAKQFVPAFLADVQRLTVNELHPLDVGFAKVIRFHGATEIPISKLIDIAHLHHQSIETFHMDEPTLEDVFISHTGRRLADG